jgi:hypothetical protein
MKNCKLTAKETNKQTKIALTKTELELNELGVDSSTSISNVGMAAMFSLVVLI